MKLDGSIAAIVTGGASGLGAATAKELASAGVKVAIFDMNAEKGEAVAKEIGGIFCNCNVTDEDSVVAAFEKARAAHGQERILVNCAGTGVAVKTVSRGQPHPMDMYERIIQINLIGTFRCISKAAAGMSAAEPLDGGERGVIVNTASVAAYDGQIGQAAYSASKGGVVGMTLPIARDLAASGIRVNTIAPGLFLTPLFDTLSDEAKQSLAASVPFPSRLGEPSEYADLARHIVENAMLNGETIRLDGAIRMAPR
ncbi:3-hydroxyacyl-CoA dehydrogenase [Marinibaculum pumilum]|uniref:3-hydroxyacyl-CoA dehydrogenase n=1 Tax=Marinibaculum pumilum TaxID=1766165 RepID=A0ABV7L793_9PROT